MSTFVSVGNATQPFLRLLQAVAAIAPQLPQPVFIQYGAAAGFAVPHCECRDFLAMEDFAEKVRQAELLILHAGAGSVIHAIHAGKVPVVMPRRLALGEHVDDHQCEFAEELAQLERIVSCGEPAQLATACRVAMSRQQGMQNASPRQAPMITLIADLLQQHAGQVRGI